MSVQRHHVQCSIIGLSIHAKNGRLLRVLLGRCLTRLSCWLLGSSSSNNSSRKRQHNDCVVQHTQQYRRIHCRTAAFYADPTGNMVSPILMARSTAFSVGSNANLTHFAPLPGFSSSAVFATLFPLSPEFRSNVSILFARVRRCAGVEGSGLLLSLCFVFDSMG